MLLFAAVVREGSFTGAARQLGISKQTTSERIAKLEAELGVRLLERTTRRLRVTGAGGAYYDKCAAISSLVDEANVEVKERQATPVGLLRVSAPVLYGRRYLAPVVASYLSQYPETRVEIVLADRRVDLIEEGFDLAIRIGKLDDSSLAARKLGEGHVYYLASPAFLARHRTPSVAELSLGRCVGTKDHETWSVAGESIKIRPALVVNDLEVLCEAAVAGVGIARLPALVCRDAVLSGRLKVLFGPSAAVKSAVYAVFPSRQYLAAKVRVFLEALSLLVEPMRPLDLDGRGRAARRPSS